MLYLYTFFPEPDSPATIYVWVCVFLLTLHLYRANCYSSNLFLSIRHHLMKKNVETSHAISSSIRTKHDDMKCLNFILFHMRICRHFRANDRGHIQSLRFLRRHTAKHYCKYAIIQSISFYLISK